jgi:hypothetical protein
MKADSSQAENALERRPNRMSPRTPIDKSFLVLFFKKELLT